MRIASVAVESNIEVRLLNDPERGVLCGLAVPDFDEVVADREGCECHVQDRPSGTGRLVMAFGDGHRNGSRFTTAVE
jgi:hypothetical protein